MYPINDITGIKKQEEAIEGSHAIILLFVKPSDENAYSIIGKINYLHYKAKTYCSIYLVGYSKSFSDNYADIQKVKGIDNTVWEYSDKCFVEVCEQLEFKLKNWRYSGEPEMIILQNSSSYEGGTTLDFRNYNYIDINYGIKKGYIDTFARFMERIIRACESEVAANEVIKKANRKRLSSRKIVELAMEYDERLPVSVKKAIKDVAFFKSYRNVA